MRLARTAFTTAVVAWSAALPAATFASSQAAPAATTYLAALAVYLIGAYICHQLPERSFFLWGRQMPVCARCTGIYCGAALTALALAASRSVRRPGRLALLAAAVPAAATLVFEWTTGVTPSNMLRAASGVLLGAAIAWLVVYELK